MPRVRFDSSWQRKSRWSYSPSAAILRLQPQLVNKLGGNWAGEWYKGRVEVRRPRAVLEHVAGNLTYVMIERVGGLGQWAGCHCLPDSFAMTGW